jgi:hypothetical protein
MERDDMIMERDKADQRARELAEETRTREEARRIARLDSSIDGELQETRRDKAAIAERIVVHGQPVGEDGEVDQGRDLHYADTHDFERELTKRDPDATDDDIARTRGFFDPRDRQAFVRDEEELTVSLHEKLHQKSQSAFSSRLNEGVTELRARELSGGIGRLREIDDRGREIPRTPSDYEREVAVADKLTHLVGDEPVNQAYFGGDSERIETEVDDVLGKGSYRELGLVLERRDYTTANRILDRYRRRSG